MNEQKIEVTALYPRAYRLTQSMVRMFLIIGSEKALLIDSGIGGVDLCEVIKPLTMLPVELVLTHRHNDHTLGSKQFENVYVHPLDADAVEHPNKLPVEDGHVFVLGGKNVEVIHIPGHTPGSIALYDREAKVMYANDTFQTGPIFLQFQNCDLDAFFNSLRRIDSYDFEISYPAHNKPEIDKSYIPKLAALVAAYREGRLVPEIVPGHDGSTRKKYELDGVSLFGL